MGKKKDPNNHLWTVVLEDGDCLNLEGDYYYVLDKTWEYYEQEKPKEGKLPNILLMDGKVVIPNEFVLTAIKYATDRKEYVIDAVTKARMEHKPDWLEIN
jgi:hypothetical protein